MKTEDETENGVQEPHPPRFQRGEADIPDSVHVILLLIAIGLLIGICYGALCIFENARAALR